MSIYRDPKRGRWVFEFSRQVDGNRVRTRKILPAGWTRTQADAYDRAQSSSLYARITGLEQERHTIDQAVSRFKSERAPELKHGHNVARELDGMWDWYAGRSIDELPEVCDHYARDQAGALAPATIKNRISYLRSACRWAWKRHKMAESDPGARVVSPTVRNAREVVVDRRQMLQLARACRHRGVRALIRIAFYSGMRVGEIVRAERREDVFVLTDTKNSDPRLVPIHPNVRSASKVQMPERSEIDYWWPLARKACGLDHVRLHDLRHSLASELIAADVDLATVGAILGHRSSQSTKRYAHWQVKRLAAALNKVGR